MSGESSDPELLKWLWTLAAVPIAWMWNKITRAENKVDQTRIVLAERHYTKLEVQDLVDREVGPLHEKLDGIASDVKYLVRKNDTGSNNRVG